MTNTICNVLYITGFSFKFDITLDTVSKRVQEYMIII